MLAEYVLILHWLLFAIGGALASGTGAALLHRRRTGAFPGESADDGTGGLARPRAAVAKCLVGVLLMGWAVAGLSAHYLA